MIVLQGVINENRQLVINLPDDLPVGPVEVVINPKVVLDLNREQIRSRLLLAGLLAEDDDLPNALEVSDAERERLAKVFTTNQPLSQLIDEDREERI